MAVQWHGAERGFMCILFYLKKGIGCEAYSKRQRKTGGFILVLLFCFFIEPKNRIELPTDKVFFSEGRLNICSTLLFLKSLILRRFFFSSGAEVIFGCEDLGLGHPFLQKSMFRASYTSLFQSSSTKTGKITSQKSAFRLQFSPAAPHHRFPP